MSRIDEGMRRMNPTIRLASPASNPSLTPEEWTTPAKPTTNEPEQRDLRQLVATELSALFAREATRRNSEWCGALESIKATLVSLERTCGTASVKLTENPAASATAITELVETIVATAARDKTAAVERIRSEAQVEIARLEGLVGRLRAEALAEREQVKAARGEVETHRTERARAEAACQEAKSETARTATQLGARLQEAQVELQTERALVSQLRRQIDAGSVEHARLKAAVQAVQRAVLFDDAVNATQGLPAELPTVSPVQARVSTDRPGDQPKPSVTPNGGQPTRTKPITTAEVQADPPDTGHSSEAPADPAVIGLINRQFAEIERMYYADVEAKRNPMNVVDRLIANLRCGYSALCQSCSSDAQASLLFERHMMSLVDSKAETSFARHLSIAAYQWALPDNRER
jgi:hypothetical protein